jgi:hypothetical protein
VRRTEAKKWENLAPAVLGAAAGLAAGYGGQLAGAEIGAAIGAAGGPIGIAVGAVVGGIIGGLVGTWVGKKAREGVLEIRARSAEPEVFAAVGRFFAEAGDAMGADVARFGDDIGACLARWEEEQVAQFEAERERATKVHGATKAERAERAAAVREDLRAAEAYAERLKRATA